VSVAREPETRGAVARPQSRYCVFAFAVPLVLEQMLFEPNLGTIGGVAISEDCVGDATSRILF